MIYKEKKTVMSDVIISLDQIVDACDNWNLLHT